MIALLMTHTNALVTPIELELPEPPAAINFGGRLYHHQGSLFPTAEAIYREARKRKTWAIPPRNRPSYPQV